MIHQPGKTMKGPGISATKPPFLGCCCLPLKNWVDGMIKTPNRNMTPSVQKPPFRKAHFQILDDTLPWKIVKTITVLQLGLMCHPRMVQQWLASRNIPHGFFWHSCQLQQLKQGKCNDLREPTHILWKKTQYPSRRTTELKHNARSNLHWRFVSQASEKPIHTYAPQYSHPPGKGRVAFHHVSKLLVESVSFLAILPNMISFSHKSSSSWSFVRNSYGYMLMFSQHHPGSFQLISVDFWRPRADFHEKISSSVPVERSIVEGVSQVDTELQLGHAFEVP